MMSTDEKNHLNTKPFSRITTHPGHFASPMFANNNQTKTNMKLPSISEDPNAAHKDVIPTTDPNAVCDGHGDVVDARNRLISKL